ncbi:hypothetical protein lbkm_4206 [Lachnospiraceae bacterium KM106-2]|nr:hypothetical protein lbkm_4206 [Lachnospiraceae bacterium KM106-2]
MTENWLNQIKELKQAVTHSGKFHADDVFSTALLRYINPDIHVERVNEVPEEFDGLAFDIGRGEFDHHQEEKVYRESKTPYAAFGLLWRVLGAELIGEEEAEKFDHRFVEPLDYNDNFGDDYVIARIISNFNPTWDSNENSTDAFWKAVDWAEMILRAEFEQIFSRIRAKEEVLEAAEKAEDQIMILERSMPWKKHVKDLDLLYVIFPSNRGGYCAQAVPMEDGYQELKMPFLKEWCGKSGEELQELSGIPTLNFVHSSGFLSAAGTLEDALEACKRSKELGTLNEGKQPVLLNVSHGISSEWSKEQIKAAHAYGEIIDFMLPKIEGDISQESVENFIDDTVAKILATKASVVYCDGETYLTYGIVRKLKKKRVTVLGACHNLNHEFVEFVELK